MKGITGQINVGIPIWPVIYIPDIYKNCIGDFEFLSSLTVV